VKRESKLVRLHLGCGKRYLPGWVHIDLAEYDHLDYRRSIDDLSNFDDSTVDAIYSSHALEYFDLTQATNVLVEWARVLCDGGTLHLAVPNFNSLVKIYYETNDIKKIVGPLFGRMDGSSDALIYHRTVYDETLLQELLHQAGFINIKHYDPINFLNNLDPAFDDHSLAFFPHMDHNGIQVSLCMSAVINK
jgi:predicted SAM-dependent methyltransferase